MNSLREMPISQLKEGKIDTGILVTPLQDTGIKEDVLFYEELLAYVSKRTVRIKNNLYLPKILTQIIMAPGRRSLFRSQIVNLCELRKKTKGGSHFEYEAGSIETLRRMVDLNDGVTIIPELATIDMSAKQEQNLRHFRSPAPVRECRAWWCIASL